MSVFDARRLDASEIAADVCIAGAGAAGITLASELGAAGLNVALIESGGLSPDAAVQDLYALENRGYPIREGFMSRARYFGGSCNLWAGRSMRISPRDMAPRPWVDLEGWPIGHDELAPFEQGAVNALHLPPLETFDAAAHTKRLTPWERKMLDDETVEPTVSLWARKPRRFGGTVRGFRRDGRVNLYLNLSVLSVEVPPGEETVRALRASTLTGREFSIRATEFVLACGGLENPRILLLSRDRFPRGVGNAFDQVGRYYMDHPRCVFGRVDVPDGRRLAALAGMPLSDGRVQIGTALSRRVQAEEGLLDPYATLEAEVSQYAAESYQSFVQTMKVLFRRGYAGKRRDWRNQRLEHIPGMVYLLTPRELAPHLAYRASHFLRRRLRRARPGRRVVVYFCEQPPDPASRVMLGPDTDALGLNRLVLDWRLGEQVSRSVRRLETVLAERLRVSGIGELEAGGGEPRFTDASHHMGTTRMSGTPRTGVVDRDCRVHGIPNLHMAGSSVFPSGGHKNPTLTILALTLRLAERIKRRCS